MKDRGGSLPVVGALFFSLAGGVHPVAGQSGRDSELWTAQVALLALRSQADSQVSLELYVIHPSPELLSPEDAAVVLAQLPKPVTCRAILRDRVLVIDCQPIHSAEVIEIQSDFAKTCAHEWWNVVTGLWGDSVENPIVVLEGPGSSVSVPLQSVVAFVRDYETAFGFGVKDLPKSELPPGTHLVMAASPSRGFTARIWR